jgi:hypothetical protein
LEQVVFGNVAMHAAESTQKTIAAADVDRPPAADTLAITKKIIALF